MGGTLTWQGGNSDPLVISVPILADTLVENDETLQVTLSDAVGQSCSITVPMTTITIVDDDTATPPTGVEQVEGDDNVEVAIAWSQATFAGAAFAGPAPLAATVLLARDDLFAD